MKSLAGGVSSEQHPLYLSFLKQLSACIFEWDKANVEDSINAKREKMQANSLPSLNRKTVLATLKKQELVLHCHRGTRGESETIESIEELIITYTSVTRCPPVET